MDLSSYIATPGHREALAEAIPVNAQYLWQIATGWRGKKPSRLMALAIEQATGGMVTRQDLRPDLFGPADQRRRVGEDHANSGDRSGHD